LPDPAAGKEQRNYWKEAPVALQSQRKAISTGQLGQRWAASCANEGPTYKATQVSLLH